MGEGSGRGSGRVGSGRVKLFVGNRGSGQRFAGSGRVQEKRPVDNSDLCTRILLSSPKRLCTKLYAYLCLLSAHVLEIALVQNYCVY